MWLKFRIFTNWARIIGFTMGLIHFAFLSMSTKSGFKMFFRICKRTGIFDIFHMRALKDYLHLYSESTNHTGKIYCGIHY
jgi:hypothetical protein